MFKINNHSSESMPEIGNQTIDLVFTSPPYNIGTKYNSFNDTSSFGEYKKFLEKLITECIKKMKKEGRLIIEVADSVLINGRYLQLSALISSFCQKKGLVLNTRYINFIKSKEKIEMPDHEMDKDFSSTKNAHSNCHHILVFSKTKKDSFKDEILYLDYLDSKEHPCPFPTITINFILDRYFKKGMNVLDPFMGTANLGVEVLKRKGNFYGYEIVEDFYNTAKFKLEEALKK
jgi:DNA modification methylase